jgi:hypothetical protein
MGLLRQNGFGAERTGRQYSGTKHHRTAKEAAAIRRRLRFRGVGLPHGLGSNS